ncbi:MAG: M28 family peptidase, partial [Actinobacteria bacterium]|nr:M28 family peptidase [Actinomycetota bacterium]
DPAIDGGAAAFLGTLTDYPGDSHRYFVPYDGLDREIPGLWLSGSDGAWLREELARGPVTVRIEVVAETEDITTVNVVGELPGATDEVVMVGSHHDGPWSSAVEDASGISLVLAQATYWAAQPAERRPHRLVFVLQGGHMSGGAGLRGYIAAHADELADVVLEVHLEHAALECEVVDGQAVPTDRATPRWFFTSRIPSLEAAVGEAIEGEELWRSLILAPDAFGASPPTDGSGYHLAGVPVVNVLAAPFYLFDEMDTLDKIDRDHLVPLTRATIRIIESVRAETAAGLRAKVV